MKRMLLLTDEQIDLVLAWAERLADDLTEDDEDVREILRRSRLAA